MSGFYYKMWFDLDFYIVENIQCFVQIVYCLKLRHIMPKLRHLWPKLRHSRFSGLFKHEPFSTALGMYNKAMAVSSMTVNDQVPIYTPWGGRRKELRFFSVPLGQMHGFLWCKFEPTTFVIYCSTLLTPQSANTVKANISFISSPYTNIIKYPDIHSLVIYW